MDARHMLRGLRNRYMEGGHHGERGEGGPPFGFRGRPGGPWPGRGGRTGWPPPGGPPGRHFGHGRQAGRGDVRAAVLALLAERPLHGYQLIQEIGVRSRGAWQPSPGSVYPALQLLEDQGLVRAEEAEGRRVFHLTEAGRAHVEEHRTELAAVWNAVAATEDRGRFELRGLFGQLGVAVAQVAQAGNEAEIAEARRLLTSTRRQLYRILADGQPAEVEQGAADAGQGGGREASGPGDAS